MKPALVSLLVTTALLTAAILSTPLINSLLSFVGWYVVFAVILFYWIAALVRVYLYYFS